VLTTGRCAHLPEKRTGVQEYSRWLDRQSFTRNSNQRRCQIEIRAINQGAGRHQIHSEAIIFDFDFTLVDSSQGIVECVAYAFQELGLPIPPAERVMDTIGLSLAATFNRLTELDSSDMARNFVRCFHQHADQVMDNQTVVYECVRPLLELLRSANIRVGVVSTKLQKNGLDSLFDTIVGADDVTKSKPDPEGLRRIVYPQEWPAPGGARTGLLAHPL